MALFGKRFGKSKKDQTAAAKPAPQRAVSPPAPKDQAALEARVERVNGPLKSVKSTDSVTTTPAPASAPSVGAPEVKPTVASQDPLPSPALSQTGSTKSSNGAVKAGAWQQQLNRRPMPSVNSFKEAIKTSTVEPVSVAPKGPVRPTGAKLPGGSASFPAQRSSIPLPSSYSDNFPNMDLTIDLLRTQKFYFEGYLFRRTLLLPEGRKPSLGNPHREWTKVYVHIAGVNMSSWEASLLERAARDGRQIAPSSTNLSNALVHTYDQTSADAKAAKISFPTAHTFTLNTLGKSQILFACPDAASLKSWITAIRLSAWERSRLLELYTGTLLATRVLSVEGRTPETPLKNGGFEGFLSVRLPGETEWRRLWAVVLDGVPAQSEEEEVLAAGQMGKDAESVPSGRGGFFVRFARTSSHEARPVAAPVAPVGPVKRTCSINFWLRKSDASARGRIPVATISNVQTVAAVFPDSRQKIATSAFFKVSGVFVHRETRAWGRDGPVQQSREGSLLAMADEGGSAEMLRWLLAIMDAFKLYGRPERFNFDRTDPNAFYFGLRQALAGQRDQLFVSQEIAEQLIDVNLTKMSDIRAAHSQTLFESMHGLVSNSMSLSTMSLSSSSGMSAFSSSMIEPPTLASTPATSMQSFPVVAKGSQADDDEDHPEEDDEDIIEEEPEEEPVEEHVEEPAQVHDEPEVIAEPAVKPEVIVAQEAEPPVVAVTQPRAAPIQKPKTAPASAPAPARAPQPVAQPAPVVQAAPAPVVQAAPALVPAPVVVPVAPAPAPAQPTVEAVRTVQSAIPLAPIPVQPLAARPPVLDAEPIVPAFALEQSQPVESNASVIPPPFVAPPVDAVSPQQLLAQQQALAAASIVSTLASQNVPQHPAAMSLPVSEQTQTIPGALPPSLHFPSRPARSSTPFTADNALAALLFAQVWSLMSTWDDRTKKEMTERMNASGGPDTAGIAALASMMGKSAPSTAAAPSAPQPPQNPDVPSISLDVPPMVPQNRPAPSVYSEARGVRRELPRPPPSQSSAVPDYAGRRPPYAVGPRYQQEADHDFFDRLESEQGSEAGWSHHGPSVPRVFSPPPRVRSYHGTSRARMPSQPRRHQSDWGRAYHQGWTEEDDQDEYHDAEEGMRRPPQPQQAPRSRYEYQAPSSPAPVRYQQPASPPPVRYQQPASPPPMMMSSPRMQPVSAPPQQSVYTVSQPQTTQLVAQAPQPVYQPTVSFAQAAQSWVPAVQQVSMPQQQFVVSAPQPQMIVSSPSLQPTTLMTSGPYVTHQAY